MTCTCPNCQIVQRHSQAMLTVGRPVHTLRDHPCMVRGTPPLVYVAKHRYDAGRFEVRSATHYGILGSANTEADAIDYAWTYADEHTQALREDYLREKTIPDVRG